MSLTWCRRYRSSRRRRRCSWRTWMDSSSPGPSSIGKGARRAWALDARRPLERYSIFHPYLNSVKRTGCGVGGLSMSRKTTAGRTVFGGTGGGGGSARGTITSLVNSPNFNACWRDIPLVKRKTLKIVYLNLFVTVDCRIDTKNHSNSTFTVEITLEEWGQLRFSIRNHLGNDELHCLSPFLLKELDRPCWFLGLDSLVESQNIVEEPSVTNWYYLWRTFLSPLSIAQLSFLLASLTRSPTVFARFTRSLPARSTRWMVLTVRSSLV